MGKVVDPGWQLSLRTRFRLFGESRSRSRTGTGTGAGIDVSDGLMSGAAPLVYVVPSGWTIRGSRGSGLSQLRSPAGRRSRLQFRMQLSSSKAFLLFVITCGVGCLVAVVRLV